MTYHQISIRYLIDLVLQKTKSELRADAARGCLGILWWVIEPLIYMFIFYFAFSHFFSRGDENYIVVLLTGLICWKWFHSTVSAGANSLLMNANLMNQVYVSKIVFPLTTILVNTVKFCIIFCIFLLFVIFLFGNVSWFWLFLPILIFVQLFFTLAVTIFLSAIVPFFRDLRIVLENMLLALFFLSGIFFDITALPLKVQRYLFFNPMALLINAQRNVLIYEKMPDWKGLSLVFLFSLLILYISISLLNRFDRIYPKVII